MITKARIQSLLKRSKRDVFTRAMGIPLCG
ncbi:Uncharacterised protein [Yersinia intermedia]|nr:Uncharacterised protein [Yersinia intermedia]